MTIAWTFLVIAAVGAIVGLGWLFHRVCLRLEEAGYLYYREQGGGSVTGVFNEFDRLARPSIEHTIKAEEYVRYEEEIDGE